MHAGVLLAAMLAAVSCTSARPKGMMGGSLTTGPAASTRLDLGKRAREECTLIFAGEMINEKTLRIMASPGSHLDAPQILSNCNRILEVLREVSPRPLDKNLDLYFLHESAPASNWAWSFPAGNTISYLFTVRDDVQADSVLGFLAGRQETWGTLSGECPMAAALAHELTHAVAPVWYFNARGALHFQGGCGWFAEGLAEYVNYLCWEVSGDCPWNHADPAFALRAFADPSRRRHLWRWQSGMDDDWAPLQAGHAAASPFWPDAANPSRASFIAPDYTTALGAFLYLEMIKGRAELKRIIRDLVARHRWQGSSFYSDLKRRIGFDVRSLKDNEVLAALAAASGSAKSGNVASPRLAEHVAGQ